MVRASPGLAVLGISLLLVATSASDPCFAKQAFGSGFDVAMEGASALPPRTEAQELVVPVEYDGCGRDAFHVEFKEHESRGGLCAVWLERDGAGECEAGDSRRVAHDVRLPLPPAAASCTTLLFAFPPGQRYEYYSLSRSPAATVVEQLRAGRPPPPMAEATTTAAPESIDARATCAAGRCDAVPPGGIKA
mmetsp:Transcript_4110/g.11666  ORF Transcript_4110/g.11666 Transcript_4110/m.11666 type:complete len:191 (-) Transcript_4110:254-826(-)